MGGSLNRTARIIALATAGAALAATAAWAAETITYTYDARGRLVKVERTGTVNNNVKAEYTYDKAENRTNLKVTSPNPPPP
jgi:YD repeat-containing protein